MSDVQDTQVTPEPAPVSMLAIFKSRLARITYICKDGKHAVFAPRGASNVGWFMTKDPVQIKELEGLHNERHPYIYQDPEEKEIPEHLADPAVALRSQIAEEERKKIIAALGDPNQMRGLGLDPDSLMKAMGVTRDMGATAAAAQLQGIGTSTNMAPGSAESNATGIKVQVTKPSSNGG